MSENEGHRDRDASPTPPQPGPPPGYRPPQPPGATPSDESPHGHSQPGHDQPGHDQPGYDQPDEAPIAAPGTQDGDAGGAGQSSSSAGARSAAEPRQYARAPEITVKVPDSLKSMRRSHWLALVLSQTTAYVTLLLLALVSVIGLTIGLLLSGSEDLSAQVPDMPTGMDLGPSAFILFLTLPFQIAAVWLFGTFGVSISMHESMTQMLPTGGDMGGNLWAPNLLYLALAMLVAVWVGRTVLRRTRQRAITEVPRLGRLIANVVLALVMAGVTLLVTWLFSFRHGLSLTDFAALEGAADGQAQQLGGFLGIDASETVLSMNGNAAGGSMFLTAFLFYLLIGLVLSVGSGIFTRVRRKVEYILPSASGVPRVLGAHALIVVVPVVIYQVVDMTISNGSAGGFSIFFWAPSMAIFSFVLLNFGAISISGGMSGFGQAEAGGETLYLWTGDFAWWEIALAILLGLSAIAVTSLVWALRRDSRASTLRNLLSWVTLPLIYALVGAVLTIFGQLRGAADLMGLADMSFHIGPVWWTFAVLLLIGLVIEALSRFAAPRAVQKLSPRLRGLLSGVGSAK